MTLAEQKALQSLAEISSEVDALAVQVEVVVKSAAIGITPAQQQVTLLHELLTQTLLKLDLVSGDGEIRVQRKAQVVRVNGLSLQLDRAVQGPDAPAPAATVAPAAAAAAADPQKEAAREPATQGVSAPAASVQEEGGQPSGNPQPPPPPPTLPAPPSPAPEPAPLTQPAPSRDPIPAPPLPSTSAATPALPPVSSAAASTPQPFSTASTTPLQKSPTRLSGPAGAPAMAPLPARQPGEDIRKKAAGMMSHALSLSDGLSTAKPPPLQTRPSLASSASAAFVAQKQPPKSAPSSAPITPPSAALGAPLVPSISDRLDDMRLAATPPPVTHSSSIHDLDSFFGGGVAKSPPPAVVPAPGASAAPPSFANFEAASQAPHVVQAPVGAPSPLAPGPAQAPFPVQYPSPTAPKLSFTSPPTPVAPQPAPAVPAAMGGLPSLAPPPPRRSSSSSVTPPDGPSSYKASSPSLTSSPQEGPRSQRRSESVPVLGNLSGFASPVPPPKPVLKETDPSPVTSPGVSSFSPPVTALSSFGTDLPSPATRSSLTRPLTSAATGPVLPPPPAPGVRSSLQATSIEEALRGALSRRESATRPLQPSLELGKAEPAPAPKMEAGLKASGQAGPAAAPPAGSQAPPVQATPAAADASSWVAFDSDFDPRAFSGSTKTSPSASRRSSYELPPPPRPAQPLFPEVAPSGRPVEQGPAAAPAALVSLLDGSPTPGPPAPHPPAEVAATPQPTRASPPSSQAPPPAQPAVVALPQQASSGPQPALAGAFPAAVFPQQPSGSSQGGSSTQQRASAQAPSGGGAPAVVPSWGDPFGQPGPPQQNGGPPVPGPQKVADPGLAQQHGGQPEAVWGGTASGGTSPGSQPAVGSSQGGLAGTNGQARPPAASSAGVAGSGPLEGFGETGPQQTTQAAGRAAYGASWPQQGPGGYFGPGFAGAGAQGYGPGGRAPGYGPAPGLAPGFSGGPPQQGLPYQYATPGQPPWLQQAGPPATSGAGYGGFGGQAGPPGGAAGQAWPYQQRPGAGGQLPYQAAYGGGVSPFPPSAQQAPAISLQPQSNIVGFGYQGGYPGVSAPGPAWPSNGGPGSVGPGTQAPAILPPWMIQPQQPASSGAGSQGQGWGA